MGEEVESRWMQGGGVRVKRAGIACPYHLLVETVLTPARVPDFCLCVFSWCVPLAVLVDPGGVVTPPARRQRPGLALPAAV